MTIADTRLSLSNKQLADATDRALKRVAIPKEMSHLREMSKEERERMEGHVARFEKAFKNALRKSLRQRFWRRNFFGGVFS